MALKNSHSLRLPDGEYFPAARKKSGIAIHHTVGGTAFSTFNHWLKDSIATLHSQNRLAL